MWKPTGEVDAYGGSVGLEAAMIVNLLSVVGVSVVSFRIKKILFLLYRVTRSQRRARVPTPTSAL